MKDLLGTAFIGEKTIVSYVGNLKVQIPCPDVHGAYQLDTEKMKDLYKLKMQYYAYADNEDTVTLNGTVIGTKTGDAVMVSKPLGDGYDVDCSPLKDLLRFAPPKTDTFLYKILVNVSDKVSFVVTNGSQLAISNFTEKGKECVLPMEAGKLLMKLSPNKIFIEDEHVMFLNKNKYLLVVPYTETGFPEYRRIIPVTTSSETFNKSFIETLVKQEKLAEIDHKYDSHYRSRVIIHVDDKTLQVKPHTLETILSFHKDKEITFKTDGNILVYDDKYLILTACMLS